MELLARRMVAVEVVKVWRRGRECTERADIVVKGGKITINTVIERSPGLMKGMAICSLLLVLQMGCKRLVSAETELGLDLLGNQNHCQI